MVERTAAFLPSVPGKGVRTMASLVENRRQPLEIEVGHGAPPIAPDKRAWTTYYEGIYREAGGDPARVPWAECCSCPALRAWLNSEAPGQVRPGASACVVGCGLGDDVRELAERGYDVIGIDVSPTAIEWARARHPAIADRLMVADLFDLPSSLHRRSDLVVEVNTLQSVHPDLRESAAAGIAALARPHGTVLTICRGRDENESLPDAPPYPLCPRELEKLFAPHGFNPTRAMDDFADDQDPPVRRLRCAFRRG
jgi:SAM-dependent methyltransferase